MTAMPQMVALFNGVGGGAAALIALADFHDSIAAPGDLDLDVSVAIVLSAFIGWCRSRAASSPSRSSRSS